MVEYTIAAIPTMYRGRQYRSRLEARWAAFFDLLQWPHEYEPFDLGSWSPDFLLTNWNMLVEVKPLTQYDRSIWSKATAACLERNFPGGLFVTADAPQRRGDCGPPDNGVVQIGWFSHASRDFAADGAVIGWQADRYRPLLTPHILHVDFGCWYTAAGDAGPPSDRRHLPYADHTMDLWARATNAVQWTPEGGDV